MGVNCLNKFNGMFAFAIWDNIENKLFIARDRYGIKPLYYSYKSSTFYFASEQKAIEKSHGFVSEVDVFALYEYLTFQNIFTNNTLKKHIKLLPAGHFAELMSTGDFKLNQYWDFNFKSADKYLDREEYALELQRLIEQAVKRQMMSDVPVGAYLSGGIDSAQSLL